VQIGIPTLVIRETARAENARDWPALNGIRQWALKMNWSMGLPIVMAVLTGVWIAGENLSPDTRLTAWVSAALVIPVALTSTYSAVLRGLRRVVLGQLPNEVMRPVLVCTLVASAWILMPSGVGAGTAMALTFLAMLLVLGATAFLTQSAIPLDALATTKPTFRKSEWIRAIVPLAMMSSLHILNQNIDVIMIGAIRGPDEAGQYKIAVSAASLMIFGLSALQIVAMPYITRLYHDGDQIRLQRLAAACAAASTMLGLPLFLIFVLWGAPLLTFMYGSAFATAREPLIVLAGAQIINSFYGLVWPLLVMTAHENEGFRLLLVATVVNIGLNALLVPFWGTIGAAFATGLSIIIWNVLFWLAARQHLGIDGSAFGLLHKPKYVPTFRKNANRG
jgi:O-antigen/teichoic acid export membrane protein